VILLCAFVVALAAAGIRSNRRRLLVIAAGVACLLLGESIPLIFTGDGHWGPGRWVAIAGAVLAVAGLALAAARTDDAVPQLPRGDQARP
jgi:CHASE2 domain-containing sensor protein